MSAAKPLSERVACPPDSVPVGSASGQYACTNAVVVVPGSEIDIGGFLYPGLTLIASAFGVTVSVYLANLADFSDEILAAAANAVAVGTPKFWAGGTSFTSPSGNPCPYRYLRLKAENTVDDQNGTLTWALSLKNS